MRHENPTSHGTCDSKPAQRPSSADHRGRYLEAMGSASDVWSATNPSSSTSLLPASLALPLLFMLLPLLPLPPPLPQPPPPRTLVEPQASPCAGSWLLPLLTWGSMQAGTDIASGMRHGRSRCHVHRALGPVSMTLGGNEQATTGMAKIAGEHASRKMPAQNAGGNAGEKMGARHRQHAKPRSPHFTGRFRAVLLADMAGTCSRGYT